MNFPLRFLFRPVTSLEDVTRNFEQLEGLLNVAPGGGGGGGGGGPDDDVFVAGSGANSAQQIGGAIASGDDATAAGLGVASGLAAFAESTGTASGSYSHAEGNTNTASGDYSHAEGAANLVRGIYGHGEGSSNTVLPGRDGGGNNHAEGSHCVAAGQDSHAEGSTSVTAGNYSHAENISYALADYSHSQGANGLAVQSGESSEGGNGQAQASRLTLAGFTSGAVDGVLSVDDYSILMLIEADKICVDVVGVAGTNVCGMRIEGVAVCDGATARVVGTPSVVTWADAPLAGVTGGLVASGRQIQVQVAGVALQDITWTGFAEVVRAGRVSPADLGPHDVAFDATRIFWSMPHVGYIGKAPFVGGDGTPFLIATGNPFASRCAVAIDASHVYWTGSGQIGRANLDGSSPNPSFITGIAPNGHSLHVDGSHVYWTESLQVGRANVDGSSPTSAWFVPPRVLISGVDVGPTNFCLAIDATSLYLAYAVEFFDITNTIYAAVGTAALASPAATWNPAVVQAPFTNPPLTVQSIAVNSTQFYVVLGFDNPPAAQSSELFVANLDGSALGRNIAVFASGNWPRGLAVDDSTSLVAFADTLQIAQGGGIPPTQFSQYIQIPL